MELRGIGCQAPIDVSARTNVIHKLLIKIFLLVDFFLLLYISVPNTTRMIDQRKIPTKKKSHFLEINLKLEMLEVRYTV